jgi:hypothetical protein
MSESQCTVQVEQGTAEKQCPYCGETILAIAVKCKHCQSSLSAAAPQGQSVPVPAPQNAQAKGNETIGNILVVLPIVAAVLIFFWIGGMNLLQDPGSKLTLISLGTVILSAILIAVEAGQLGMGIETDKDAKGRKQTGPAGWFLVTLLLWIVGYPAYLYHRSKYGRRNLIGAGILAMLLFLGAAISMNGAIENQKASVRSHLQKIENIFNE